MMHKSLAILAIACAAGAVSAKPNPFNPICILPWMCPPSNDTSANVSTTFNSSGFDNFTASASAEATLDPLSTDSPADDGSDDEEAGATVTEVITIGGEESGDNIETIYVEETQFVTIPEVTETITVAVETVTVDPEDPASSMN